MRVGFKDDADNDESLTSAATATVVAAPEQGEPPAQPQGLTGTVTHVVVSLTWDDPGDDSITGYQILRRNRDTSAGGVFEVHVEDTGSTATSYVDRDVTPETRYAYRIKARNAAGLSERSRYFTADTPPAPSQNSPATGVPSISGTAQVGETLTPDTSGIADADGLDNATFSYQWQVDDTDITGATDSTYTLTGAEEGKTIRVRVSFTDDAGYEETLTSAATSEVAARPNSPATGVPTISGTARVGETLAADTSGIGDADGLDNAVFGFQWSAVGGNGGEDIQGATEATYVLTEAEEGEAVMVRVSFTDDAGNGETLTSAATSEVAARPNSPATGLPAISGVARVGETLAADASGIEDADGLDNATFSYQWVATDGGTDLDIQGATEATYTLIDIDAALRFMVRVSFTDDAGNEEMLTSEATGVVAK